MTIYDFINTCCTIDGVEFSIFDCNSEKAFDISEEDLRYSGWGGITKLEVWIFSMTRRERVSMLSLI